jgi:hypothetical protein
MARMDSIKASDVKVTGELAKNKLASKLNSKSSNLICLNINEHKTIIDAIGAYGNVSLRVGKNWQFHLGEINEISSISSYSKSLKVIEIDGKKLICGIHDIEWNEQIKQLKSYSFWDKYFAKGSSVFCFSNDSSEYFFFNIKDIINYIIETTEWRLLKTGRIKGDLSLKEGLKKTIFTIEFRNESHKKCFAFGAHGGNKGIDLFLILLRNIKHYHTNL